jgi:hypothetical protein
MSKNGRTPGNAEDKETVVRDIIYPFHFKKSPGKRMPSYFLFEAPRESAEVSVLRLDYGSHDRCKNHAQKLVKKKNDQGIKCRYWGLAFLKVISVRECGADVIASPLIEEDWLEHADIKYPMIFPGKGEPIPPILLDIMSRLLEMSSCIEDKEPDSQKWSITNNIG